MAQARSLTQTGMSESLFARRLPGSGPTPALGPGAVFFVLCAGGPGMSFDLGRCAGVRPHRGGFGGPRSVAAFFPGQQAAGLPVRGRCWWCRVVARRTGGGVAAARFGLVAGGMGIGVVFCRDVVLGRLGAGDLVWVGLLRVMGRMGRMGRMVAIAFAGGGFVQDTAGPDLSDGLVHFFDVAMALADGGGVARAAGFELFYGAAESFAAFSDSAGLGGCWAWRGLAGFWREGGFESPREKPGCDDVVDADQDERGFGDASRFEEFGGGLDELMVEVAFLGGHPGFAVGECGQVHGHGCNTSYKYRRGCIPFFGVSFLGEGGYAIYV